MGFLGYVMSGLGRDFCMRVFVWPLSLQYVIRETHPEFWRELFFTPTTAASAELEELHCTLLDLPIKNVPASGAK